MGTVGGERALSSFLRDEVVLWVLEGCSR